MTFFSYIRKWFLSNLVIGHKQDEKTKSLSFPHIGYNQSFQIVNLRKILYTVLPTCSEIFIH